MIRGSPTWAEFHNASSTSAGLERGNAPSFSTEHWSSLIQAPWRWILRDCRGRILDGRSTTVFASSVLQGEALAVRLAGYLLEPNHPSNRCSVVTAKSWFSYAQLKTYRHGSVPTSLKIFGFLLLPLTVIFLGSKSLKYSSSLWSYLSHLIGVLIPLPTSLTFVLLMFSEFWANETVSSVQNNAINHANWCPFIHVLTPHESVFVNYPS